jgi:hypothetical protein
MQDGTTVASLPASGYQDDVRWILGGGEPGNYCVGSMQSILTSSRHVKKVAHDWALCSRVQGQALSAWVPIAGAVPHMQGSSMTRSCPLYVTRFGLRL